MASENNKRLAKNTIVLYIRMILTMVISLYTSRVVLNALGIDDFGVYNAIAGFISMFSLVSYSLSISISRYLAFDLEKKNTSRLREIFSGSMMLLFMAAVVIVILVETFGVWFLNAKMVVPAGQEQAANWVLQFSAATFVLNLISVPYNSAIIAHEKMTAYAYMTIAESLGKLAIAFLITLFADRLVIYAAMLCALALIIRMAYVVYCNRQFDYCKLQLRFNLGFIKELFSFTGWNFFGTASAMFRDQGVNLLLNVFCGPAVNAARGISMQVYNAVRQFSTSFTTAINPQIIKNYAAGNRQEWNMLVDRGARFSTYLLLLPALPIFLEAHKLLVIWLKIVPPYAPVFVRLVVLMVFVEAISFTLESLMLATGKIRGIQLTCSLLQLMNFPLSWILLKLGYSPVMTLVVAVVLAFISVTVRLPFLRRTAGLQILPFLKNVVLRICMVAVCAAALPVILLIVMPESALRFVSVILLSLISTIFCVLWLGCSADERGMILAKIKKIF